eukprot:CAMPEP_0118938796 /NCGR_PEP_ID=MMETSP1169-20130426/27070_1 /TAXON_ID=36882 /ORGANISM="Pyramimonas obovata, Strain CCMP722" /LENGTH=56 /DNA_ID=CAMNT_0006882861 /DNA_START=103 /DNA_END=270 /DNA_ORIENTATION=+
MPFLTFDLRSPSSVYLLNLVVPPQEALEAVRILLRLQLAVVHLVLSVLSHHLYHAG